MSPFLTTRGSEAGIVARERLIGVSENSGDTSLLSTALAHKYMSQARVRISATSPALTWGRADDEEESNLVTEPKRLPQTDEAALGAG
jgi:hypothetical protein